VRRWGVGLGLSVVLAVGATTIVGAPATAAELHSPQSWTPPARAAGGIDTALAAPDDASTPAPTPTDSVSNPTPAETDVPEATPAPESTNTTDDDSAEADGVARSADTQSAVIAPEVTPNAAPAGTPVGAPGLGALPFMQFQQIGLSYDTAARVNLGNGNLLLTSSDGTLSGPGIGTRNDRFYNGLSTQQGSFGGGWSSSLSSADVRLNTGSAATSVTFVGPTGFSAVFTTSGSTFTPPANFKATLTHNAGNGTYTLTYNSSGEKLVFDSFGTIQSDKDRNGIGNTYSYLTGGKTGTVTHASGRAFTFTWNSGATRIDSITDSASRTWTYTRNTSNQLTRVDAPAGEWEEYDYDSSGRISEARYPDSGGAAVKVAFTYDSQSRVTAVKRGTVGSSTFSAITGFAYAAGQTTVTDPNSHNSAFAIDSSGRVTSATDALSHVRSQTWTSSSDIQTSTDAIGSGSTPGNVTTYAYDSIGNATSVALPTGAASAATYQTGTSCSNTGGDAYQVKCSTDAAGNGKSYNYDANGNMTSTTDTTTGGTGAVTATYTYQGVGGVSCGGLTGQICTSKDGNNHTTSYTYNSHGDLTLVTPPAPQGTTSYYYDSLGRVTSVTDGNGDTTEYSYNARDEQTEIRWLPNSTSFVTTYYASGLRNTETDSVNGAKSYTWDVLGRMTEETGPDYRDIAYTYDAAGNLTKYDEDGYAATYGDVNYTYDAGNNLRKITQWGSTCPASGPPAANSGCILIDYNNNNAEITRTYPGNATVTTGYDNSSRPLRIQAKNNSGTVVDDIGYSYTSGTSDRTNIQTRTSYLEQGIPAGAVTTYSYDSLNRLTSAVEKNGATQNAAWTYGYDPAGNRTTQTRAGATGATAGTITYNYDAANRITTTSADTTTWTYDGDGNQTRNGITAQTMSYNPRGAVNGINGNQMAAFGAGNSNPLSQNGPAIAFSTSSAFQDLASTYTNASGATRAFTNTPGGDTLAVQYGAGSKYYFATDSLGSVTGVFDSTGAWQGGYSYSPYGEARFTGTATSVSGNSARYISGYYDTATKLYRLGARYYDPSLGRFTQQDPSGQDANQYAYASADPLNRSDPTGLYDLAAAAGDVANFAGAGAGLGTAAGCAIGFLAAGVGCVPGAGAGAVIGTIGGTVFGLGYAVGQSLSGEYDE
jgi:RHS repeat-associated protein